MKIEEARQLKIGDYVNDGVRNYQVSIYDRFPYDLWFWGCRKNSRKVMKRYIVKRVNVDSKSTEPWGLDFLDALTLRS